MKFTTQYSYNRGIGFQFATHNDEPSMTQQSDKDDCDINIIMKKFGHTGSFPQRTDQPEYGDYLEADDYRTGLDRINAANEMFMELDPTIRKEFENDAAKFLEFVHNPENIDKMIEMGLATRKEPEIMPEPIKYEERFDDNGRTIQRARSGDETPENTDPSIRGRTDDLRLREQTQPRNPKGTSSR